MVLLHDGVVNSAVWDDVFPTFCKQFHAIRYDRRGCGRSPTTTKPYYEADDNEQKNWAHSRQTSACRLGIRAERSEGRLIVILGENPVHLQPYFAKHTGGAETPRGREASIRVRDRKAA